MIFAAYIFLVLHAPNGAEISIALNEIVSMREGEHKGEVFTKEVGCLINTEDGKFISVVESCKKVRQMIKDEVEKLEQPRKG